MRLREFTMSIVRDPRARVVGLFVIAIGYGFSAVGRQIATGNDFPVYLDAARALLEDRSPYAPGPGLEGYVYLPFFALALSPLAFLPQVVAVSLWYAVNLLLTAASVLLTRSVIAKIAGRRYAAWAAAASLVVHARFFLGNYDLGQINILLLCLLMWSVKLALDGRPFTAGWPLGIAAVIKPHAVVLLAPFLIRRRWGTAAGFCAAAAIAGFAVPALVLGVGQTRRLSAEWHQRVIVPARSGTLQGSMAHDQSPQAALRRLVVDEPAFDGVRVNIWSLSDAGYVRLQRALQAMLGLVLAAAWLRRPRGAGTALLADVALAYIGMLALFGYLTRPHFVMLLLPGALLAHLWRTRSDALPHSRVVLTLLLLSAGLIFLTTPVIAGRTVQQWALAYSAVTIATLVQMALLLVVRFRLNEKSPGSERDSGTLNASS